MPTPKQIHCPSCRSTNTRVLASWQGRLCLLRCERCVATRFIDGRVRTPVRRRPLFAKNVAVMTPSAGA